MEINPKNTVQSVAKVFAVLKAFDATLPELTISEVGGEVKAELGTYRGEVAGPRQTIVFRSSARISFSPSPPFCFL